MARKRSSIPRKINALVARQKPGHVLTTHDFLHLGSRSAVDQALSRLARDNKLIRISRGMFYIPVISDRFGPLSPSTDQIAAAMGRQTSSIVQPVGAAAANALGL